MKTKLTKRQIAAVKALGEKITQLDDEIIELSKAVRTTLPKNLNRLSDSDIDELKKVLPPFLFWLRTELNLVTEDRRLLHHKKA